MWQRNRNPFRVAVAALLALFTAVSPAVALSISSTPLFLTLPVKPNIILTVDDSGSMDAEILLPSNDGAAWWHSGDQSFVGRNAQDVQESGVLNYNSAGTASSTWQKYVYLFPNGTGSGRRVYGDSTNDHFAIPPIPQFAFFRSPDFNPAYFDPAVQYSPWVGDGVAVYPNADPASAKSDPALGTYTFNLTANLYLTDANHTFKVQPGMRLPAGTYVNGVTLASESVVPAKADAAIRFFPATFYLKPTQSPPAGFGYTGPVLVGKGPDGSDLNGYEIKPANFSSAAAYSAAINNFANWFTYYRKRHIATRGGIGHAFKEINNVRIGNFTLNNRSPVTMRDLSVSADRNTFYQSIYGHVGSGGTPTRQALQYIGTQYKRTDTGAPITHACQQNFGVVFTDGFADVWTDSGVGNADGDNGPPYADSMSNTMADIAMYYYENNLRPDLLTGKVLAPTQCASQGRDPRLDCNKNLHLVTFGVTLGAKGTIFGVDSQATEDPFAHPPTWPVLFPSRHPSAVDDLWHATLNGRGDLFNANSPKEISDKLASVLNNIATSTSSSAAVASDSTHLQEGARIYQARFNSGGWYGQLLSYELDENTGNVSTFQWDVNDRFPAYGSRKIYTFNPSANTGIPFAWDSLTATQKDWLNKSITGVADGLGQSRLAYLYGDTSKEVRRGGPFRNRSLRNLSTGDVFLLGDIINSDPYVVNKQNFAYDKLPVGTGGQSTYLSFLETKENRTPVLYVGANDGMLHAFNAQSGAELFAYVPSVLFPNLSALTAPNYTHRFYVDGSPRAGDAFLGGVWKTILLGSLGAGGQSIFAMDVTDPTSFNQGKVLWEISPAKAGFADLGFTFSQPTITVLSDGTWVGLFGNGYDSVNGNAVLYIVNLADGSLKETIDVGGGPDNGLSTVIPVDTNGDRMTDLIYAGDLKGNVWKFRPKSNGSWGEAAFKSGATPAPLFAARDSSGNPQPITSRMEVGRHTDGTSLMIYFGTGKYFETGDNIVTGTPRVHTLYGIKDTGARVSGRSDLQQQTITHEITEFGRELRIVSKNTVADTKKGWFMDLVPPGGSAQGERVVSQPLLRHGRAIFTTLIPSSDPCEYGGTSWLMELDALTGGRLSYSVFDFKDPEKNLFNEDDFVTVTIDGKAEKVPVTGMKSQEGITKTPIVISAGEVEYKYTAGTSGEIAVTKEKSGGAGGTARQSWRQIQ